MIMANQDQRVISVAYPFCRVEKESVLACIICGGDKLVRVADADRYGYDLPTEYCMSCGMYFLGMRPTAKAYAEFYQQWYRPLVSAWHGRTINAETIQSEQLEYGQWLADLLQPFMDKDPESLLDIGGSTGVVARKVATSFSNSSRITVLDPAPDELAHARDLETIASTAEDFDPLNRRWDLVLCCQTIDHCPQPINVMMTAAKCMAPGGLLWIDFVDVHDVGETGEIPWKIDHPCGFTLPTAARAVEFAGLRVIVALRKDHHIGLICTRR